MTAGHELFTSVLAGAHEQPGTERAIRNSENVIHRPYYEAQKRSDGFVFPAECLCYSRGRQRIRTGG